MSAPIPTKDEIYTPEVPGPWAVDNRNMYRWSIVNMQTGRTRAIGPVTPIGRRRSQRVNYFDRAMKLASERNMEHAREQRSTVAPPT